MTSITPPKFDKHGFWAELKECKAENCLKHSKQPHEKAAKRITVLVSNAFLSHCPPDSNAHRIFVLALESSVYRLCKEKKLDCDRLPAEDNWFYYWTNPTRGRESRKITTNEFEEHSISNADNDPKAELFANIITDYLALEEEEEEHEQPVCTDSQRKGNGRHARHKEGRSGKVKKERLSLR